MRLSRSLGLASAVALAASPAIATATPRSPVAAPTVTSTKPVAALADQGIDYAKREAQDKQVASFEGGSVVVIGISPSLRSRDRDEPA